MRTKGRATVIRTGKGVVEFSGYDSTHRDSRQKTSGMTVKNNTHGKRMRKAHMRTKGRAPVIRTGRRVVEFSGYDSTHRDSR